MPSTFPQKIVKGLKRPGSAMNFLKWRFSQNFGSKEFVAEEHNRSESEGGPYVAFVQRAVQHYNVFRSFKRHPSYRTVLEHVNAGEGAKYLDVIKSQSPQILNRVEKFKENDLIGNPITHSYPQIGNISPTTLRYMKVASDLQKYFGDDLGKKIVEIGVGYGGQLLVNDRLFNISEYHLYDLPPVLNLASKYLESFILDCSYKISTLNQSSGDEVFDLVISNYAFSELPSHLQRSYIKKIISKASKGYLTMNSGMGSSRHTGKRLSVNELRELLPPFEIIDEIPKTSPDNYIIIWGHRKDR